MLKVLLNRQKSRFGRQKSVKLTKMVDFNQFQGFKQEEGDCKGGWIVG